MNLRLCDAIRSRVRIEFVYDGLRRVVEPYCHGVARSGREALRGIQVGGASNSPPLATGKLWTVDKMLHLHVRADSFAPNDPHYNPNDSAMASIHCCI